MSTDTAKSEAAQRPDYAQYVVCAVMVVVGAFLQEAIDVVSILWALTALIDRD